MIPDAAGLHEERVIDVLARTYGTAGTFEHWRDELMLAMLRLHPGARTCTWFEYDWHFDPEGLSFDAFHGAAVIGPDAAIDTWLDARRKVPSRLRASMFGRTGAGSTSQLSGLGARVRRAPAWPDLWHEPVIDSFGMVATEPDGRGVCVSVGLLEVRSYSKRELRVLQRLAVHLSAGLRLRRAARPRPMRILDEAEAVLSVDGRLLHARDEAIVRRSAIEEGSRHREVALRARADADQTLEIWRGLVAGRWSLVDHFDTDGKRFVVAVRNAPGVDKREGLSPRERRVSALAAMGHRDKEIAYSLGLSLSSVTGALHRARGKLGVRSRSALATLWRGQSSAGSGDEGASPGDG